MYLEITATETQNYNITPAVFISKDFQYVRLKSFWRRFQHTDSTRIGFLYKPKYLATS